MREKRRTGSRAPSCDAQLCAMAGYFAPHGPCAKASRRPGQSLQRRPRGRRSAAPAPGSCDPSRRAKIHRVADGGGRCRSLNDGLWENGITWPRESSFRPSTTAMRMSWTPRVFGSPLHDAQPEFGAFGLFDPDAGNLLGAVRQGPERDVDRLVAHEAFVADLDPNGIEEH